MRRLRYIKVSGCERDGVRRLVVHQQAAVTIIDSAARRKNARHANSISLGYFLKLVPAPDLQPDAIIRV